MTSWLLACKSETKPSHDQWVAGMQVGDKATHNQEVAGMQFKAILYQKLFG